MPHFLDRNLLLPPWGEHFKSPEDNSKGQEPSRQLVLNSTEVWALEIGEYTQPDRQGGQLLMGGCADVDTRTFLPRIQAPTA